MFAAGIVPSGLLLLIVLLALALNATSEPKLWASSTFPAWLTNSEGSRKYLPATMPGGIAVFDYDGDGLPDIFFTNGGDLPSGRKTTPKQSNRLFRNLGSRGFADVTAASGLAGTQYSFGAAVGDYDGDGRIDLLVSHVQGVALYRNAGGGRFEDVTKHARIDNKGRWSVGAAWFDFDADGDQDLYVVNYVRWNPSTEPECRTAGRIDFCHPRYYEPQSGVLFRNNGDGTFTDVTDESGISKHLGKGMGVAVLDYDGDHRPDLFVTNDKMPAFLFHNIDGRRFEEVAFEQGIAVPADGKTVSGMGVDVQDIDRDGHADLIYTALRDETFPLYTAARESFDDVSVKTRMAANSRPYAGWGVAFADLDNDGRPDAVAATSDALSGKVDPARAGPVVWFRNTAGGTFEAGAMLAGPAMYRGLVPVDLDKDGCIDLVVSALDAAPRVLWNPCAAKPARAPARRQWLGSSTIGYASSLWDDSLSRPSSPAR